MYVYCVISILFLLSVSSVRGKRCSLPEPPTVTESIDCNDAAVALETLATELTSGDNGIVGQVVTPMSTIEYDLATDQYANYTYPQRLQPEFVILAEVESDVQAAVIFAKECGYKISARSGGHSYLALSSCNTIDAPCIQIDVGRMNGKKADAESGELTVGPGNRLDELADLLDESGLFLPTGVCAKVGLGGHIQTGGVGLWSRPLGPLASHVSGFRVVLSNGAIKRVVTPSKSTSKLNDDLYYAVLGGGSGSWGVVTELTLNAAFKNEESFSVFWEAQILWDEERIKQVFRKVADQANTLQDDRRWGIQLTVFGLGSLPNGANFLRIEGVWIGDVADKRDYDYRFFQDIIDACVGCTFLAVFNSTESASSVLKNFHIAVPDGWELPEPFRYYDRVLQQTSSYPDANALESLANKISSILPSPDSLFPYAFFSQPTYSLGRRDGQKAKAISLPWPDVQFGATLDLFVPFPALLPQAKTLVNDFASFLTGLFGEDNRMYWGAYEPEGLIDIKRDQHLYFENTGKFNKLQKIKSCVDPDDVFCNLMSIPPKKRWT